MYPKSYWKWKCKHWFYRPPQSRTVPLTSSLNFENLFPIECYQNWYNWMVLLSRRCRLLSLLGRHIRWCGDPKYKSYEISWFSTVGFQNNWSGIRSSFHVVTKIPAYVNTLQQVQEIWTLWDWQTILIQYSDVYQWECGFLIISLYQQFCAWYQSQLEFIEPNKIPSIKP